MKRGASARLGGMPESVVEYAATIGERRGRPAAVGSREGAVATAAGRLALPLARATECSGAGGGIREPSRDRRGTSGQGPAQK